MKMYMLYRMAGGTQTKPPLALIKRFESITIIGVGTDHVLVEMSDRTKRKFLETYPDLRAERENTRSKLSQKKEEPRGFTITMRSEADVPPPFAKFLAAISAVTILHKCKNHVVVRMTPGSAMILSNFLPAFKIEEDTRHLPSTGANQCQVV